MSDFFRVIIEYSFLQNAILAGILSSVACGITGTFVVIKKMSYLGGGIAHAVFGGLGIAYFLGAPPLAGALVFALLSAILIGLVSRRLHQNEDTIIAALWSIGMAIGLIFTYRTPGYQVDLLSFLFGNILMVSTNTLLMLVILDLVIIAAVLLFYHHLVYVCFDEEYALLRGISVDLMYSVLLCMIALTVVVLIQTVGLILVIALITLPAAIAELFSRSPARMIVLAVILSTAFSLAGIAFSFSTNLPTGASIILVTGTVYLLALGFRTAISRMRKVQ